jgi:hypothetical protein
VTVLYLGTTFSRAAEPPKGIGRVPHLRERSELRWDFKVAHICGAVGGANVG